MFRPFKVLRVGGAALRNNATAPGTTAASVIDFAGPVPRIRPRRAMPVGLQWHNATTLPDGNVVVTGGSSIRNQLVGTNYIAYHLEFHYRAMELRRADHLGQGAALPFHRPAAARRLGPGRRRRRQHQNRRRSADQHQRRDLLSPLPLRIDGQQVTSRPTITDAPASLAAGQSFQSEVSSATPIDTADPDQDRDRSRTRSTWSSASSNCPSRPAGRP